MNNEEFISFFNKHDACSREMGIRLLEVGDDFARAELPVTDVCRNMMGALHGGALATLVDIVAGCSTFRYQKLCVTLSSSVHYHKGIIAGTATATARVLRAGGRICTCQVEIRDDANELCCTATVTMYFTDKSFPALGIVGK